MNIFKVEDTLKDMNLSKIKYYIPITFALLFVVTLITFGLLSVFGVKPFTKKSTETGVMFILAAVFLGFYPGLMFGHGILYIINKSQKNNVMENV